METKVREDIKVENIYTGATMNVPEQHNSAVPAHTHVLPEIFSCGVLTPEHVTSLKALNIELADNWKKRQVFRTECEMLFSVLNDASFPTQHSKYWQCVREQGVMLENLAANAFDFRRNEVELKRWLRKLETATDELDIEEYKIEIEQCLFKREQVKQQANDRMREIELWSSIKKDLDDGSFDTEDFNAGQLMSLYEQLKERQKTLGPASQPDEIKHVLGPLATIERFLLKNK